MNNFQPCFLFCRASCSVLPAVLIISRGECISFKAAKAELKMMGKGDTEHYPAITSDDLVKLYSSVLLNQNTPVGLADKVKLDIYGAPKAVKILLTLYNTLFVLTTLI